VPDGQLWLAPVVPADLQNLLVERVPLAGHRLSVSIRDGDVQLSGLPPGLTLMNASRPTHFDDPQHLSADRGHPHVR
jgi:hypothetical protein